MIDSEAAPGEPTCFNDLVGTTLREKRIAAGLPPEFTALALGKREQDVIDVERGLVRITDRIFGQYCQVYKLNAADLMEEIKLLRENYYKDIPAYNIEKIKRAEGPKKKVSLKNWSKPKNDWSKPRRVIDPLDRAVGERIQFYRLDADMKLYELGQSIGVSGKEIRDYEFGASRLKASTLLKISWALDVDISCFFDGIDFS